MISDSAHGGFCLLCVSPGSRAGSSCPICEPLRKLLPPCLSYPGFEVYEVTETDQKPVLHVSDQNICVNRSLARQHEFFLRDKPHLLAEIRRATHYGATPEKQEVDDLRSEVGSLRSQVVDMDGRIDALSKMVDRLLEAGAAGGGKVTPIPPLENWAKKRRLDGELAGAADTMKPELAPTAGQSRSDSAVGIDAAGFAQVKPEVNARETGTSVAEGAPCSDASPEGSNGVISSAGVKTELTEEPEYKFAAQVESLPGDVEGDISGSPAGGDGMIIGGGALCRDTSFIRNLDNMSIGSVSSLALDMIDLGPSDGGSDGGDQEALAPTSVEEDTGSDVLNDSLFDIDFEAEITSMSEEPTFPAQDDLFASPLVDPAPAVASEPQAAAQEATNATVADVTPAVNVAMTSKDQTAKIQEVTACLDSMPPESRRKLVEGLMALAQNNGVVSTFPANAASSSTSTAPPTIAAATSSVPVTSTSSTATTTAARAGTPEIAMPLASAAIGAFMLQHASAFMNDPAAAVAAVTLDSSQRTVKRTTSLR